MSGIAGVIRFDGGPAEPGLVEKMTGAMDYRGPDGITHWARGSAALGHCMLHTTPESLEETQPLANEDESLVLVMDGRLDNWEELRAELLGAGARLRSRADAELVLRAYQQWGGDCLAHMDGDFALVIWDARKREAFCARDRMGLKPFCYHWDGARFVFASDIHPILAALREPAAPNEGMLVEFLTNEWRSPDETIWSGVFRLAAAHKMIVTDKGPSIKRYWAPDFFAKAPCCSDAEYFEHYRALLTDIVRRRCRSHRPVAFEVSGGLDSSAIFCLADRLDKTGAPPSPGIAGYTLDFVNDASADELFYARAVGERAGRKIEEVPPSVMDFDWYARRAAAFRDFPGYPNAVMQMGLYERAAAQGARVVLTGLGGDHFLVGSNAYYAEELAQGAWRNFFGCLDADSAALGPLHAARLLARHGLPTPLENTARAMVRGLRRGLGGYHEEYWLSPKMRERLLQRRRLRDPLFERPLRAKGQRDLLQNMLYPFDCINKEQIERLAAGFGLEIRHPYFSARFVEFAFATPERLRSRGGVTKYIHRQALKDVLPQAIGERVSKAEFSCVFEGSFSSREKMREELAPHFRAEWLERDGALRLFDEYFDAPQGGWRIWILWGILATRWSVSAFGAPRAESR